MKPLIEIQRIGTSAFAYRVKAEHAATPASAESGSFPSLTDCLADAAVMLDHGIGSVELSLEGLFMGTCAIDVLRRDPEAVARRIQQHFQPASA